MKTFIQLYMHLRNLKSESIIPWLKKSWKGKDKQETLLRLFAGLGLIVKLDNYCICKGNFNMNRGIVPHTTKKDVFIKEGKYINIKDKGDKSDLTMVCKKNGKKILIATSKNRQKNKNEGIGKYDIRDIHSIYVTNYPGYKELVYCICTKDKERLMKKIHNCEECNFDIKEKLLNKTTIIIDWNDLDEAYQCFKTYSRETSIKEIMKSNKPVLKLRMHQELGVLKTLEMKKINKKRILWGHIQRSGKSYILGGCIIEDSKNKDECNYLVITTAPSETIEQQRKVFECEALTDFNVVLLNGQNKKPVSTKKNIILCSKQFLQTKILNDNQKKITWLKEMSFDIRFIDESHNGGTTELAKKTLDFYGKNAFTVQITATYFKPIHDYNIPKSSWILWDLDDIKLCKSITKKSSIDRLVEKHGPKIKDMIDGLSVVQLENIINEYSKFAELQILTWDITSRSKADIISSTRENDYGWSLAAAFLLNNSFEEFQNETEMLKIWYNIFGKANECGIPDIEFPDSIVFMKRIEQICNIKGSRFIGKGDFITEPMIILAFLPVFTDRGKGNLKKISDATKKLLEKHKVLPDYDIISINEDGKGKEDIENARIRAKNFGKKGVLVLSGTKCGLGVSIDNCDIVVLLNDVKGYDRIYQMMFRCMTEGKNKKYGFVIDPNIQRVINTSIINYASLIKPDIHPREAIKYLLQEKLINLNADHWEPSFGNKKGQSKTNLDTLSKDVYDLYSSHLNGALDNVLKKFNLKNELLSKKSFELFYSIFKNIKLTKQQHEELCNIELSTETIKKGFEKKEIEEGIQKKEIEDIDKTYLLEKNKECNIIQPIEILKPVSILISLLTVHDSNSTTLKDMYNAIKIDLKNILLNQVKMWWGKNITNNQIEALMKIFIEYTQNDKETERLIRTIKELFCKNITNLNELSKVIDKYLIPQELEKKTNAEVSTPFQLRQEMLDTFPDTFWKSPNKVFEPCPGKGGFLLDIIHRFSIGLEKIIPDEKQRYKKILEECVYFCDINPTNIFICKLLIDPYNEYTLNYHQGNTLDLNIQDKWGIEGFDAVIGNPPYQAVSLNGVSKGGGNNLYTKFIYYSDKILKKEGFLLFINPPTYFSPGRSNNKNNMNLRKDVFDKYYYHFINLEECAKHFNVGSKFIYYLIQKNKKNNNDLEIICKYNKKIYKTCLNQKLLIREYLPCLLTKECLNILNKVKNNDKEKLSIFNSFVFDKRRPYVLKKKKIEKQSDYKNRAIETGFIYPIQATSVQLVYSSKKCKNQNDKKVLMSESGYLKPFYDNGIKGVGGHCFACLVKNEIEGDKIIKLITSKLYMFYIITNKWSGFHNKVVLRDLPNIIDEVDYINNQNIYKYFKITKEEIQYIENSI